MSRNEPVDVLRQKIDQIDAKVVNLLNDRASLAQRIGRSKSQSNQEVYVPHREKDPDKPFGPFFARSFRVAGRLKAR